MTANTVHLPRSVYWPKKATICAWCDDQFGEYEYGTSPRTWSYSTTFGSADFYFRNAEDAMVFALRWLE